MHREIKTIHVVINPASGQPQPILHVLNSVCRKAGIEWDISITRQKGDAEHFARQAGLAGVDVVAANGGDGTVMEVARGLIGTSTPMAILPGGTANLLAVELGISKKLDEAAALLADPQSDTRWIDAGLVGDELFLLRVGIGFSANRVKFADRSLKDRFGIAAYSISAIKSSVKTKAAEIRLSLDGKAVRTRTLTCLIDNAGNMGQRSARPTSGIDISDGLLDVILLRSEYDDIETELPGNTSQAGFGMLMEHWQAAEIVIETDPPQPVQVDGEMYGDTPIRARVRPRALQVIVPALPAAG
jgi:YegS/Rv2252/BmrU family lipid kinase